MSGGDLMDGLLLKRRKALGDAVAWMTNSETRVVTWRVLKALEYMHCVKKIVHRDLKSDNVLLARLGADGCGDPATSKLADMGHAKVLEHFSRAFSTDKGTVAYAAPEVAIAQLPFGQARVRAGRGCLSAKCIRAASERT